MVCPSPKKRQGVFVSLMKKRKLNTWKSTTKTLKVKINENVIELKEGRSLFARMCVVVKSRPEIDLKDRYNVSLSLKSATRLARQGATFPFLVKEKRNSKLILTISLHARSFVYLQNFRLHLLHSMRESQ